MNADRPLALIVDDDPGCRRRLRAALEQMGFAVLEAAGGRAAASLLERERPGLVCLDLTLPEMSAYDLCERIRRTPSLADVPVLAVGEGSRPLERAHAEEAGASAYLSRPVKPAVLAATVEELVGAGTRAVALP